MNKLTPVNYLIIALLIAVIVSMGACMHYRKAAKECANRPSKTDTFYKHTVDSSKFQTPTITKIEKGNIQTITKTAIKTVVVEREGKTDTVYLKADVEPVLNQCAEVVHYSDTVLVEYGQAIIKNRVHGNRLDSQQLILKQSIPIVTKTVMPPIKKPKRFGIGLQVGYGLSVPDYKHPFQNTKMAPYVGAGMSYNVVRF